MEGARSALVLSGSGKAAISHKDQPWPIAEHLRRLDWSAGRAEGLCPRRGGIANLGEDGRVVPPRRFENVKAMVGALEPMHVPARRDSLEHTFHRSPACTAHRACR